MWNHVRTCNMKAEKEAPEVYNHSLSIALKSRTTVIQMYHFFVLLRAERLKSL